MFQPKAVGKIIHLALFKKKKNWSVDMVDTTIKLSGAVYLLTQRQTGQLLFRNDKEDFCKALTLGIKEFSSQLRFASSSEVGI